MTAVAATTSVSRASKRRCRSSNEKRRRSSSLTAPARSFGASYTDSSAACRRLDGAARRRGSTAAPASRRNRVPLAVLVLELPDGCTRLFNVISLLQTFRLSCVSSGSDNFDCECGSGHRFFGLRGAPPSSSGMKCSSSYSDGEPWVVVPAQRLNVGVTAVFAGKRPDSISLCWSPRAVWQVRQPVPDFVSR